MRMFLGPDIIVARESANLPKAKHLSLSCFHKLGDGFRKGAQTTTFW